MHGDTHGAQSRFSGMTGAIGALIGGLLLALFGFTAWLWHSAQTPLLLAPAIGGLNPCLEMAALKAPVDAACTGDRGSAAARIESALQAVGPRRSSDGQFELGYTLLVPLLNLFEPSAGDWGIDQQALQRIARTVEQVDRPMVLYLFSTHFSEGAPIEAALAQDVKNLAESPQGPLPIDRYMGSTLYPWSIARTDNTLTQRREQAIAAVTDALCGLPAAVQRRVVGVNLLGEVHHLYPDFEAGMGYGRPYVVTDYSEASRQGFRRHLKHRFGDIAALNALLGSSFNAFDAIDPPSKNIREDRLDHYWQHIDTAAAGNFTVAGWVHDAAQPDGATPWIRVYLNGQQAARVAAHFVRQDVGQAKPELGTDRVGWRADLPYAHLPAGTHRVDVVLERPNGVLLGLGTRQIAVMDRRQSTPVAQPMRAALPPLARPDARVNFWIDAPAESASFFYNPLVPLWHDFRGQQVVDYLTHFDELLSRGCFGSVPRRTQQIYPAEKAGWDATRFAAGTSLLPFGGVQLGINLYGEATYDDSFFDWLARSRQPGYSVTEFHPLRAMNAAELRRIFERHRVHGARTLSFFLHPPEATGPTGPVAAKFDNPYALDPQNPQHGSNVLFGAVREIMR